MTWEDDILASYEAKRGKKEKQDCLASQRNALLESGHQNAWITLRVGVWNLFMGFNEKSSRQIFKSTDPHSNSLSITREDGEKLTASYDADTRTAKFESGAVPFGERLYRLSVRTIDGNDSLVWVTSDKNVFHDADELARDIVQKFMNSGLG